MRKRILIGGVIALGVAALSVMAYFVFNPSLLLEMQLGLDPEFSVFLDGEEHVLRFEKYESATSVKDCAFFYRKMVILHLMAKNDEVYQKADREYRTALISASVTGKVDVREEGQGGSHL